MYVHKIITNSIICLTDRPAKIVRHYTLEEVNQIERTSMSKSLSDNSFNIQNPLLTQTSKKKL